MKFDDVIKELLQFQQELERVQSLNDAKVANLNVALTTGDYAEIEKARFEVISTFEAALDLYIKVKNGNKRKREEFLKSMNKKP